MAARKQLFRDSLIGRLTPVPDLDLAAVCAGGGGMSQFVPSTNGPFGHDEPCMVCGERYGAHLELSNGCPVRARAKVADPVNSPGHYTWHPAGVECIRIIEVFPHNIAAAMGYLWRHDHKGEPIQDMRKAIWHIEREIKRRGGE